MYYNNHTERNFEKEIERIQDLLIKKKGGNMAISSTLKGMHNLKTMHNRKKEKESN